MFCAKCGILLPDGVKFCHRCGWQVPQQVKEESQTLSQSPQNRPNESTQSAPEHKQKSTFGFLKSILSAAVAILIVVAIVYAFQKHPANDLKNVVFDNYGTATFGDAVDKTMRNVEWETDKISKTHYQVTVTGFVPDLYINATLVFDLNYSDDHVYANLDHIVWDSEYLDDIFSLSFAMTTIYGD